MATARTPGSVAHDRALIGQRGLQHAPAVVQRAQHIVGRHDGVGNEHLVEMGFVGDLAQGPHLDPGLFHGQEEEADALVLGHVPVGAGDQHAEVGHRRAGGPDLLTIDDIVIAVAVSAGADGGKVGACPRLAIEQAHADFTLEQGRNDGLFEGRRRMGHGGIGPEVGLVLSRARSADGGKGLLDDLGLRRRHFAAIPVLGPGRHGPAGFDDLGHEIAMGMKAEACPLIARLRLPVLG